VLLSVADGQFYTGLTSDLRRRLEEQNLDKVPSTKHRIPFRLVDYKACLNRSDAAAREKYLKPGMGKRNLKNRMKDYFQGLAP
jgi:putative endonuclease